MGALLWARRRRIQIRLKTTLFGIAALVVLFAIADTIGNRIDKRREDQIVGVWVSKSLNSDSEPLILTIDRSFQMEKVKGDWQVDGVDLILESVDWNRPVALKIGSGNHTLTNEGGWYLVPKNGQPSIHNK